MVKVLPGMYNKWRHRHKARKIQLFSGFIFQNLIPFLLFASTFILNTISTRPGRISIRLIASSDHRNTPQSTHFITYTQKNLISIALNKSPSTLRTISDDLNPIAVPLNRYYNGLNASFRTLNRISIALNPCSIRLNRTADALWPDIIPLNILKNTLNTNYSCQKCANLALSIPGGTRNCIFEPKFSFYE